MIRRHLACVVLWLAAGMAHAAPIADSIADFSNVQGQDGWFYGFFNQGVDGSTAYTTGAFTQFETFGDVEPGVWGATDAQVGAQNNDYLMLGSATGHPTGLAPPDVQDRIIWAVRRYESEVAGDVDIKIDLRKFNPNPSGGITGRVFVDGVEVYTQFVAFDDLIGYQTTIVRNVALNSLIEFAIDPLGVATDRGDGIYSPRSDGTHFSAVISPHAAAVPIAPTFLLMIGGLVGLIASRRPRPG
jgi:hypothetical protein